MLQNTIIQKFVTATQTGQAHAWHCADTLRHPKEEENFLGLLWFFSAHISCSKSKEKQTWAVFLTTVYLKICNLIKIHEELKRRRFYFPLIEIKLAIHSQMCWCWASFVKNGIERRASPLSCSKEMKRLFARPSWKLLTEDDSLLCAQSWTLTP